VPGVQGDVVLEHWTYRGEASREVAVLPDGCRDLILVQMPEARPVWQVTPLAGQTERVPETAGAHFEGFRLHPGVRIDSAGLLAAVGADTDIARAAALVREFAGADAQTGEALAALAVPDAERGGMEQVARTLGVRIRTLQRLLSDRTGRSPVFWQRLARVRRAAALACDGAELAALAYECGFSDQPHMTRELRRWFGVTPRFVQGNPDWRARYLGRGYGV
jgi:AraC-like DNA-binding protein